MEYERFFHFGSDPQAAKWYLLTGSCAVPQRLLCLRDYAIKKEIPAFGYYSKKISSDKEVVYSYVIVNIFDIPFNELVNFFVNVCDSNDMNDDNESAQTFDVNFQKTFMSARAKQVANINIKTNTEELSSSYLDGVRDFVPQMDWHLNMPVMPCNKVQSLAANEVSNVIDLVHNTDSAPMDTLSPPPTTFKRRNEETDTSQEKQPKVQIIENIQLPNVVIEPPPPPIEDESLFYDNDVSIIDNTISDFPSIAQQGPIVASTPTPPITMDLNLNKEQLSTLGEMINRDPRPNWFGTSYDGRIVINENKLYVIPKDHEEDFRNITESYDLHPDVLDRYQKMKNNMFYPTYFQATQKQTLLMSLTTIPRNISLFQEMVQKHGPTIISIVDSENDSEFERKVNASKEQSYWLLAGLYKYLKNRNSDFSTFMEIMASMSYGDFAFTLVSNMYARVYFAAKGLPIKVTKNSVNLYHIQNLELRDEDMRSLDNLIASSDFQSKFITALPKIKENGFEFKVENGKIISDTYFCINLFAIDEFFTYIVTERGDVYLSTMDQRNRVVVENPTLLFSRYSNLPNVFIEPETKYLGMCSY
ncbi:hypothetical protein [Drosophila suzukii associated hytrosavirus 1]|nr:hypothetical protein [Drosophila suzukii associated hytrosavirus 1]